jgi:hypothetical protein
MGVIPSIYSSRTVGNLPFYAGGVFGNTKLHLGEVREIVEPTDKRSVSKLFNEYTVLVSQLENGLFAHKLYRNCLLINPLASGGDHSEWRLRASTKPIKDVEQTDGSRVLILCVEGSNNQPIIIGGLRDERCGKDDPGVYYNWQFNGVNFKVQDDGSWELLNKGKTNNLGNKDSKANDDGIGTSIKTDANGDITLKTAKGTEIKLNNNDETIDIKASSDVTINSNKIHLGENATQPNVLGLELIQILTEMITNIMSLSVVVAGTTSTPPINAPAFASVMAKLNKILSQVSYTK